MLQEEAAALTSSVEVTTVNQLQLNQHRSNNNMAKFLSISRNILLRKIPQKLRENNLKHRLHIIHLICQSSRWLTQHLKEVVAWPRPTICTECPHSNPHSNHRKILFSAQEPSRGPNITFYHQDRMLPASKFITHQVEPATSASLESINKRGSNQKIRFHSNKLKSQITRSEISTILQVSS